MNRLHSFVIFWSVLGANQLSAQIVIPVSQDVMASAFFQGDNQLRGYAGETPLRETHRVSSNLAFDVGPEVVFMTFDFDFPGTFSSPLLQATLHVTSVPGGFSAEATPENPFQMAASAVSADPLISIMDDTNPAGVVSWTDFFADQILDPDPAAITTVTGVGELEFDVTTLVNSWIDGSNNVFALALNGKFDTLSDGNILHGIANNSFTTDTSHFLSVVVPEPSSLGWIAMTCVALSCRRLRKRPRMVQPISRRH